MEDPVQAAARLHVVHQQGDFVRDQGLKHHLPHDGDGGQNGSPFEFPQHLQQPQPGRTLAEPDGQEGRFLFHSWFLLSQLLLARARP